MFDFMNNQPPLFESLTRQVMRKAIQQCLAYPPGKVLVLSPKVMYTNIYVFDNGSELHLKSHESDAKGVRITCMPSYHSN